MSKIDSQALEYALEFEAKPDVRRLLHQTVYGSEGGFCYRHMDTEERISKLIAPEFFVLRKAGKTLGTVAYLKRTISHRNKQHTGYYIRYFSVDPEARGQGIGTYLHSFADAHYRERSEKSIFYAYIEHDNVRSMKVSKTYNFAPIGQFKTVLLSRFFPQRHPHVKQIEAARQPEVMARLKADYHHYQMVHFNRIFDNNNYFAAFVNGKMVAGCRVHPVGWEIANIAGFSGWLTLHVIPHLPVLGRLFNRNYRFLTFEAIFCDEGCEPHLFRIFETAMKQFGVHTGMYHADVRCPMRQRIIDHGKLGFISKMQDTPAVAVLAEYLHYSEKEKEALKDRLMYISAFDLS